MLNRTIFSDFFTTISLRQFFLSLYSITFRIFKLKNGEDINKLEYNLLSYLGLKKSKIISFYNGRSAIYHCIETLKLTNTDEVIVNGYNCITVSNAVIQTGAKIIYSDIEIETLSFDVDKLKENINKNTKAIILQHTFGIKPKYYNEIISLAQKNNILIIEDCAHSLGNKVEYKGDFLIFSTGRDKVISTVTGGFLVINNKKYFNIIDDINEKLKYPTNLLIIKNHLYNLTAYKSYKLYDLFKIGRIIMHISMKIGLLTKILTNSEKQCNFKEFNYRLPNSLAFLGLKELEKLDKYTQIRKNITLKYLDNIKNPKINFIFKNIDDFNYFRIPILLENKEEKEKLYNHMRKNNILLGKSWSGINIAPIGSNLEKANYKIGSCRNSEDISSRILTIGNSYLINNKDIEKIINIINKY